MLVSGIYLKPVRPCSMKVCTLEADKTNRWNENGRQIMGIETIKWGLVASIIWFCIYQVFTIISGVPLF